MTKRAIYLLLSLCVFSCQSMKSFVGTYSLNSKDMMVAHTLVLNTDSSFHYTIIGDLLRVKSTGIWSISNKGNLVLSSDESLQPGIIHSIEEKDQSVESFSIKIVDEYGSPLSYAAITLNSDTSKGFTLNENGIGYYNPDEIETIDIDYLGSNYHHLINRSDVNLVKLKIRLDSPTDMYLDNDIWKIKGEKLINCDNVILTRQMKH